MDFILVNFYQFNYSTIITVIIVVLLLFILLYVLILFVHKYYFVILNYFIFILSDCNRVPFDLIEAESELIAGFIIDYSSIYFSLILLTEYGNIIILLLLYVMVLFFMNLFYYYLILVCLIRTSLNRIKFNELMITA